MGSQEKLEQRHMTLEERIVDEYNATNFSARLVGSFALKMVRRELGKAAKYADKLALEADSITAKMIADEIRKLMKLRSLKWRAKR